MRIVRILKATFGVHTLNYVTSLVILRLAQVVNDHADAMYEIAYVVWFAAILTYLPVPPFHIIVVSHVRFHAHDFYRADVGL